MDSGLIKAIMASNADIQAFISGSLPGFKSSFRRGSVEHVNEWAEFNRDVFGPALRSALKRPEVDEIRESHGFVRCGDAPGWRYVGG